MILGYCNHDELAAGCKAGHKWSHRVTTRSCRENRPGSPHSLQHRSRILDGRIDVGVRAQLFRKVFLLQSPPDRDSPESHLTCELNPKMPKATNALHGDQIAAAQAGVAKS